MNPLTQLKALCRRCFPPSTLLADLENVYIEQQRKVLNHEDDLISVRLNLAREKARLRFYTKALSSLRRDLASKDKHEVQNQG